MSSVHCIPGDPWVPSWHAAAQHEILAGMPPTRVAAGVLVLNDGGTPRARLLVYLSHAACGCASARASLQPLVRSLLAWSVCIVVRINQVFAWRGVQAVERSFRNSAARAHEAHKEGQGRQKPDADAQPAAAAGGAGPSGRVPAEAAADKKRGRRGHASGPPAAAETAGPLPEAAVADRGGTGEAEGAAATEAGVQGRPTSRKATVKRRRK